MLNDTMARAAKPRETKYSIADIRGLHLEIMPTGRKFFRFRYTSNGKRSWFTIGEYPMVSIKEARSRVPILRQRAKDGLPLEDERELDMRFSVIAEAWAKDHDVRLKNEISKAAVRTILNLHVLPYLGESDIRKITPPDVLAVLQKLASDGKFGAMRNTKLTISQVFKYAAANGHILYDPCTAIRGAISSPPTKHFATMEDKEEIGDLLRRVNAYPHIRVRLAITFLIYAFCRPGELIRAEWSEVDFETAQWRVPAEKMKKARPHIVPLSRQLVEILRTIHGFTGHGRYVFANVNAPDGSHYMSCATVRTTLRRMGFDKGTITPHGFRGMASTILNENRFNSDWIERQLAHVEGNKVRAAYCHTDFLDDRRVMVQWYGDYLDELRGEPINLE